MKSRLSSTVWMLVLLNSIVLFAVLGLAYSAGKQSGGASILDLGALPSGASGPVMIALVLVLGMAGLLAWRLFGGFVKPVQHLAEFSERLASGDPRARAEVSSSQRIRPHRGEPQSRRRQSFQSHQRPGSERESPAQHHRTSDRHQPGRAR